MNIDINNILDQIAAKSAANHGLFIREGRKIVTRFRPLVDRAGKSARVQLLETIALAQNEQVTTQITALVKRLAKQSGITIPGMEAPKQIGDGNATGSETSTNVPVVRGPRPKKPAAKRLSGTYHWFAQMWKPDGDRRGNAFDVDLLMAAKPFIIDGLSRQFSITLDIPPTGPEMSEQMAFGWAVVSLVNGAYKRRIGADDEERILIIQCVAGAMETASTSTDLLRAVGVVKDPVVSEGLRVLDQNLPEPPRPPHVSGPANSAPANPVITAEQAATVQATPDPLDPVYDSVVAAIKARTEDTCPRAWLLDLDGVTKQNVGEITAKLDASGITKHTKGSPRMIVRP